MKIEGFFKGIKNANEAVAKLNKAGVNKAFVDLNEHYTLDSEVRQKELGPVSTSSLSDLVLNSGNPEGRTGESPLFAASPMVSGFGKFEEIADINYKVIVETDSKEEQRIKDIIQSTGGSMQSPNVNMPQRIKDINLAEVDPDFLGEQ